MQENEFVVTNKKALLTSKFAEIQAVADLALSSGVSASQRDRVRGILDTLGEELEAVVAPTESAAPPISPRCAVSPPAGSGVQAIRALSPGRSRPSHASDLSFEPNENPFDSPQIQSRRSASPPSDNPFVEPCAAPAAPSAVPPSAPFEPFATPAETSLPASRSDEISELKQQLAALQDTVTRMAASGATPAPVAPVPVTPAAVAPPASTPRSLSVPDTLAAASPIPVTPATNLSVGSPIASTATPVSRVVSAPGAGGASSSPPRATSASTVDDAPWVKEARERAATDGMYKSGAMSPAMWQLRQRMADAHADVYKTPLDTLSSSHQPRVYVGPQGVPAYSIPPIHSGGPLHVPPHMHHMRSPRRSPEPMVSRSVSPAKSRLDNMVSQQLGSSGAALDSASTPAGLQDLYRRLDEQRSKTPLRGVPAFPPRAGYYPY